MSTVPLILLIKITGSRTSVKEYSPGSCLSQTSVRYRLKWITPNFYQLIDVFRSSANQKDKSLLASTKIKFIQLFYATTLQNVFQLTDVFRTRSKTARGERSWPAAGLYHREPQNMFLVFSFLLSKPLIFNRTFLCSHSMKETDHCML